MKMKLYVGLDVHSEYTYSSVLDEKGNSLGEGKFATDDMGFKSFFRRFKRRQFKIHAVFEASRSWNYVADLLRKQEVEFIMAHPLKVRAIASARIKTDRIDSKVLADLLRADLIPQSYMPPEDIIDLRSLVRHRVRLGKLATQAKNTIRTVLAREGKKCSWTDLTGIKARLYLNNIQLKSLQNKTELEDQLSLMDLIQQKILKIERKIKTEAVKRPESKIISSMPGFAEYSALLILSEIGDIKRFQTPQQLASYAGLVSSTYQSSNTFRQGGITKQGSKWLRWMLIQCCNVTIRKKNRIQKFYLRIKSKKGHNKAIVATARKTLTIIWTMLQKQQTFQQ